MVKLQLRQSFRDKRIMKNITKLFSLALGLSCFGLMANTQVKAQSMGVFTCEMNANGIPTTYLTAVTGKKIELISWQREGLGGYTKQERCQIVSQRFQEAYEDGTLAYITYGFMAGQNVICGTSSNGGACEKLLLTLRHQDNPKETIESLFAAGSYAGSPVIQSNGEKRYYYTLTDLLGN
jgi:hypothetical protein